MYVFDITLVDSCKHSWETCKITCMTKERNIQWFCDLASQPFIVVSPNFLPWPSEPDISEAGPARKD